MKQSSDTYFLGSDKEVPWEEDDCSENVENNISNIVSKSE
jgi:hypothetical protein